MMVWIAFILLVVLILLGAPVPACFGGAVMFLMFTLGYDGNMLLNTAYNSLNAYNLLAIPLFIMAGGIMEKGNIGEALVGWITMFFGRVRASLAIVTSVVSAIFGSVCGSGAATLSCIGSMVAPRMREKNYPMAIGASVSVCAAPLGLLIPPSAMQILYAFLTQKSVLGCFLAIVIPGIILCILIAISGWFLMRNDENIIREEPLPKGQRGKIVAKRTVHAVPALLMPFIILGGIYGGIMTATEAAAVSIIYSIPVSMWIYKGMKARDMKKVFTDTACTTGVVMVMVGFVMMFARVLTLEKFPQTRAILETNALYRFTSAAATFLASGKMQDEAVLASIPMAGSAPLEEKLRKVSERMKEGHSIAQAAYDEGLFEPVYGRMLLAGERSGSLEHVLVRLCRLLEEDSSHQVDRLVGIVSPALSGILMVTIGLTLISVMLPLIGMMNAIG